MGERGSGKSVGGCATGSSRWYTLEAKRDETQSKYLVRRSWQPHHPTHSAYPSRAIEHRKSKPKNPVGTLGVGTQNMIRWLFFFFFRNLL
jgi:hypothetical protein